ncbi:ABC transporter permease [Haloarcula sp. 1CSR25-25]|uniref:ABC transporter permease n=1 Tax=Haloarcula sp. 1CSR25-25 TaxID=2862545 RepID=UPI002893EB7E|nr:ABC transporter permease [Haloarcula sp. 1CSR25-25]MDT3435573.1 ABC transporter permease [Haloarcula sp. 1CSR25-25]
MLGKLRAQLGIAFAQLRHDRLRTVLAILGVAMAVLATVLLVSVGFGVIETGQQKFDQSGRDLWVTGGPVEIRPGSAGGFENTLVDSHSVAANITAREDVATAVPMGFQTVYVGKNTSDYQTLIGAGAPARGPSVQITEGRGVGSPDTHYAGGQYDGPMTRQVVIDQRTATLLNVSVNDTLYIGGTLATARQNKFTVVGISPTYSRFIGAPTVTMHLSELQEVTGTTVSDRGTFISIRLQDGANVTAVENDLQTAYPEYTVRTNREQLQATIQDQIAVIASGVSLVVLAVVAGILLTLNLQLSFVYQRRETFAALQALGTPTSSLSAIVLTNTLLIGLLGGLVGIGVAYPATWLVNRVAAALSGFEQVVTLSDRVLLGGLGVAVCVSLLSAVAASLYLRRLHPLSVLRG